MQPHEKAEYERVMEEARVAGEDLAIELEVSLVQWMTTHRSKFGDRNAGTTMIAMLAKTLGHMCIIDHVITGRCFHKQGNGAIRGLTMILDSDGITMQNGSPLWAYVNQLAKAQRDEQKPPTNPGPETVN